MKIAKKITKNAKNSQKGYVLATAIAVMGVILVLSSMIIAICAVQNSSNKRVQQNFEFHIFCEQMEYDFVSLNQDELKSHLLDSFDAKIVDDCFVFGDKYKLYHNILYDNMKIYNQNQNKLLFEIKVDSERKVVFKEYYK